MGALFSPETSMFIQKHHPYTGSLNPEMPDDSQNAFLHWETVLAQRHTNQQPIADRQSGCRGITPCMVGIIPYAGLDIAAFEVMREKLHEQYDHRPPPQYLLLAGMLSSTGAQLVAYPLGLIRTRLQVGCH